MEPVIHLDTHVVVWLYAGDVARLEPVRRLLEQSALVISPMVVLELHYLFEVGRTRSPAEEVVADLVSRVGLSLSGAALARIVAHALTQSWTRDPFDRVIVGNALAEGACLVTRDETIRRHSAAAVWG